MDRRVTTAEKSDAVEKPRAAKVVGLQERRLGRTILRTRPTKLDVDDLLPNEQQPRMGPKEDIELQTPDRRKRGRVRASFSRASSRLR